MSDIINPLKWIHRRSDNVVYANPTGMRFGYYIKPNEINNHIYELAYVEYNGAFKEHGVLFERLELAQEVATKHYHEQILANILPEFAKNL